MQKIDWIVHLVQNGAQCAECGEVENGLIPLMCNAHTHGMEKYGHQDFQIVLNIQVDTIMYILNTFGSMVQKGRTFHTGELVDEICEGYQLKLLEVEEANRKVLRVLIPDENHKFPGDEGCEEAYCVQTLPTDEISVDDKNPVVRIYQMSGNDARHRDFLYEGFDYIRKNHNGKVPYELYEKVFDGKLGTGDLMEIDYIFNMKHPYAFKGHSLSVSDIVELEYSDGKKVSYYYDRVGFVLISFSKNTIIS